MAEAAQNPITDPMDLADVYRHVHGLGHTPEDAKTVILNDMLAGRLPHLVARTIIYLPRAAGADLSEPPPMELRKNEPMPTEVLTIGVAGRGSLHIDWQNSNAIRKAGTRRPRMEFEDIRLSREAVIELYPQSAGELELSAAEAMGRSGGERRKVGAKPKYDWEALQSECLLRLHPDGEPENHSALGRDLLNWYDRQFGVDSAPDIKTLMPYLERWIAAWKRSLPPL